MFSTYRFFSTLSTNVYNNNEININKVMVCSMTIMGYDVKEQLVQT